MLLIKGRGKHLVCLGHSVDVLLLSTKNCPQIHLENICTCDSWVFFCRSSTNLPTRRRERRERRQSDIFCFVCENWNYTVTTQNKRAMHVSIVSFISCLWMSVHGNVRQPMYAKQICTSISFNRKFLEPTHHLHCGALYLTVFKHFVRYDEHIFFVYDDFPLSEFQVDLSSLFSRSLIILIWMRRFWFIFLLKNHSSVNVFNVEIINV